VSRDQVPAGAIAELLPHVRGAALMQIVRDHHISVVCQGRRRFLVPRPGRPATVAERIVRLLPRRSRTPC